MDRYVSAQPSGFTPDPGENDNSVNYLRRLKAQTPTDISSDAGARMAPIGGVRHESPTGSNRRRSPRYQCDGSVAFTAEGGQVRMWGTLTDISLHGFYIEMNTTFPVDTKADVVVDALGIRFRAKGVVRISYPFLGMGILMTEIDPEQRVFLDQLLSTLAQATTVANPLPTPEKSVAEVVAAADPLNFVSELRRFFDTQTSLSREEFLRIAERCPRP